MYRQSGIRKKHRDIKSGDIIHRRLAKYRVIPSGGIDGQYTYLLSKVCFAVMHVFFCLINLLK